MEFNWCYLAQNSFFVGNHSLLTECSQHLKDFNCLIEETLQKISTNNTQQRLKELNNSSILHHFSNSHFTNQKWWHLEKNTNELILHKEELWENVYKDIVTEDVINYLLRHE